MLSRNEMFDGGKPTLEYAKRVLADKTPQQTLDGLDFPRRFYDSAKYHVKQGSKILGYVNVN